MIETVRKYVDAVGFAEVTVRGAPDIVWIDSMVIQTVSPTEEIAAGVIRTVYYVVNHEGDIVGSRMTLREAVLLALQTLVEVRMRALR